MNDASRPTPVITPEVQAHFVKFFLGANQNMTRVARLVNLYKEGQKIPQFLPEELNDVLRGAVILLHATLESFVRDTVRQLLRDKQVSEPFIAVILDKRSFNRWDDVLRHLEPLVEWDISIGEQLKVLKPDIERLAQRRHQIAHAGDFLPGNERPRKFRPIDVSEVESWHQAVLEFALLIIIELVRIKPSSAEPARDAREPGAEAGS